MLKDFSMETSAKTNPSQTIARDAVAFPTFFTFVLSIPIFGIVMGVGEGISGVLAYVIWGLANFTLCYFMVRKYPKSAWIVWFPPNLMIFVAAFVEPNFWTTDMWKVDAGVFLLSIVGSVLGVVLKKKNATPALDSSVQRDS
jgi:hypothetical protein